jgi:hypothetical protein
MPKEPKLWGRPPFEPHRAGPFVIYRSPYIGLPKMLATDRYGRLTETSELIEVNVRFATYDLAMAFVLAAAELNPSQWRVGRR